jgi:hypothetical protein
MSLKASNPFSTKMSRPSDVHAIRGGPTDPAPQIFEISEDYEMETALPNMRRE